MSMFEVSTRYTRRGWAVLPVPYRSKNPDIRERQQLRLAEPDLTERLNGQSQNIGFLVREPYGRALEENEKKLKPFVCEMAGQNENAQPVRTAGHQL